MTCTAGAREAGLYLSQDDDATWAPFTALPFRSKQRVVFDPTRSEEIILTTFGSGVFSANHAEIAACDYLPSLGGAVHDRWPDRQLPVWITMIGRNSHAKTHQVRKRIVSCSERRGLRICRC